MRDLVPIAVIGAGYWGRKVIEEYRRLATIDPKVRLSIVCDVEERNLRYCNETYHIPQNRLVTDYEKVLSLEDVVAVHICTPNETHYQIGKEALSANKHVMLEKPMALNAKHAWELVRIAESSNLILQVGHIFRFNNAMTMMRDLIDKDYLGSLYYMKLQWTTLMPSPLNRDIIFDLGPHPIDILNYLLNKWPTKVICKARAFRRKSLEELAYITMEFDGKLIAHIELSWLQPGKVREATVVGSERSAIVDCLDQSIEIRENSDGDSFDLAIVKNNTILDELSHFAASVQKGKNSNNSGYVGAKNVTILETIKRSFEQGRTLRVSWQDLK